MSGTLRHAQRNEIVVLRSVRAGLRAKEIAELQWAMLTDAEENIGSSIQLTDKASKGRGGRVIPLNLQLRLKLADLLESEHQYHSIDIATSHVIRNERSEKTSHKQSYICLQLGVLMSGLLTARHTAGDAYLPLTLQERLAA